jgi:hypothetical protein
MAPTARTALKSHLALRLIASSVAIKG